MAQATGQPIEVSQQGYTLGLHVLFEPENASPKVELKELCLIDSVVAVHGLGGDSYSTWIDPNSNCLWLRDLLPQSNIFKESARILTFGYDAKVFVNPSASAARGRTFTFAEELLNDLDDKRGGEAQHRPIIFVGHSLGGIVIKAAKALCYAHLRKSLYSTILDSTYSIVFFGTPHQGTDSAVWATYLGKIGTVFGVAASRATRDLKRWSDPLLELSVNFAELVDRFEITTFFEGKPVNGVMVAPEGTVRLGLRRERCGQLDGDHRTICKFSYSDPKFNVVKNRFDSIMQEIMSMRLANELPVPVSTTSQQSLEQRLEALTNFNKSG
ncbi:hypothetical protein LOZ54_001964 [Ophidiomyces ophidiicola]|nr:hypothetical protein LOZ54_001964 [Ophidiomyces ophidiicola]